MLFSAQQFIISIPMHFVKAQILRFWPCKKLYSYVTNKNRVGSQNRGSKNTPEKESKGTKMKYEIVGIEHAVGDFTPTTGKKREHRPAL